MSLATAILGFPRIGAQRELKSALEKFWKGEVTAAALDDTARAIRLENWQRMQRAGIRHIPSGDFSFYDQVLDHSVMFGAIPARYRAIAQQASSSGDWRTLYFAMARGLQRDGLDVVACDMTKWFDTNYHYIVPEFSRATEFKRTTHPTLEAYREAKAAGIETRPVLIGPISYLLLGKMEDGSSPLSLLPRLLPLYETLLSELSAAGAAWVQIDEPFLALDLTADAKKAYETAYKSLNARGAQLMLTTYFAGLRDQAKLAFGLGTAGVHLDLVREPQQFDAALSAIGAKQVLSLGVVNGRNIWKTDYAAAGALVARALEKLGEQRVLVASSCSLLHSPVDLAAETKLDAELRQWLAFAQQKIEEVRDIAQIAAGEAGAQAAKQANEASIAARRSSARIHRAEVKARLETIDAAMLNRKHPFAERIKAQQALLKLPLLPTTTIGSFPQTADVREARAKAKSGALSPVQYDAFLEQKTRECVAFQEEIGIDVPVHGEFERNDMVEYFGERLDGFAFTQNGWVQSYGSRCVKPPVIFGDVARPAPMTVRWSKFAQSLTKRPMKGMLTGPVTILQWSFVRDDQPRAQTCRQIALAIRDEVLDLEQAGIRIIQIDEPAIREGLPLRNADKAEYLRWAVDSFRLSAAGVADATQIHTHMCYSEFNDIMDSIAALDADVISIETSRSAMALLSAFVDFKYPNQIGPGVYDIHSPRVPNREEMIALLRKALEVLEPAQIWVNPDCGLKTRGWPEVRQALGEMVAAAAALRPELGAQAVRSA